MSGWYFLTSGGYKSPFCITIERNDGHIWKKLPITEKSKLDVW